MTDLEEQFRTLDRLDAPDLWPEAQKRQPGTRAPTRPRHPLAAAVLAFTVAAAGVGLAIWAFRGPPPAPKPRPAATPGSERIAFAAYFNGRWQIFSVDADGSDIAQLTDLSTDQFYPAWSPDGTRIAFSAQGGDGFMQIWVMDASGGDLERLTRGRAWNYLPQWSPDGSRIAFVSSRDGNEEVFVMNADGSEQTRLTDDPDEDLSPAWSPDGDRIAFQSNREGNNDIYVMSADGSQVTNLTNTAASGEFDPAWSPDGTRIAFVSDRDGDPEIYVMDEDGSSVSRVTRDAAHDRSPAWSPDGSAIVFESDRAGTVGLFVLNLDGGTVLSLTDVAEACCPAWQPGVPQETGASPGVAVTRCTQATTSGDFDGDGTTDEAEFIEVASGSVSCDRDGEVFENLSSQEVLVRFGSGQTLEQPFTDCQGGLCAYVFTATDLDGNGRDELAIDLTSAAAIGLVEFYRVDPDAVRALVIADPGDPPFVRPGPAILGGGFDSGVQSPIVCRVNENGSRELISIHAENVGDRLSGPWKVHTTTMVLQGDRLVVTSTGDAESSFPETTGIPSFSKTSPFENGCF
ncbi:MAG TPA: LpqB family beta-propeller domain-containing protein [Actinomycetota bacterium]|nr:LpqB family beta-propeller domain-containing protein [Actinomycetota bacterium]